MPDETNKTKAAQEQGGQVDPIVSRMDADECHWDSLADFIQCKELGFCGCGRPDENLKYVMNGLSHINESRPDGADHSEWFDAWVERGHKVFGNEASRYFFFYWADKEKLTEHGGSVPGWLTEKGNELLAALKALEENGELDG